MPLPKEEKQIAVVGRSFIQFFSHAFAITEFEVRKLKHDPSELITRSLQPFIWLLLFGQVISHGNVMTFQNMSYLDFITPGILAKSILFIAIFHGLSVIWEKDLGIVHKLLVAPISRFSLVFGKALAAAVRSLSQVLVIYVLALLLGVKLHHSLYSFAGVLLFTLLGAGIFSTFSLIIACIVKTRERFLGIGQVLTMPLFFASNAIYPIAMMPHWLQVFARVNPLSYEVDGLRIFMLDIPSSMHGLGIDILVLSMTFIVMMLIGARLYPRLAQ
jgi:ABC-2 type transport system permease protein